MRTTFYLMSERLSEVSLFMFPNVFEEHILSWCRRSESNRHAFRRVILSHLRIPVSPRRQKFYQSFFEATVGIEPTYKSFVPTINFEAREGFEPSHSSFADCRVASSPSRHTVKIYVGIPTSLFYLKAVRRDRPIRYPSAIRPVCPDLSQTSDEALV